MHAGIEAMAAGPRSRSLFPAFHKADRYAFPGLLALLWAALLAGFVPEMIHHATEGGRAYLPIVHVHAVFFVGWMVLLTAQMTLVRRHLLAAHRRLGLLGAVWAPALVLIGCVTVFMVHRSRFGTPEWDPGFLAIQMGDLVNFSIFVSCALWLRADAASHKRLMLLAAISLSNAGFGRFWGDFMIGHLGNGFLGNWAVDYLSDAVIIIAFLLFDTLTRGRPHRVLAWGGASLAATGLLATWLYLNPAWARFTAGLIRP